MAGSPAEPIEELEKGAAVEELSQMASSTKELSVEEIDPVAEARLLRKLDWIIMPMFTAIYVCNFIDRTSIGNARVAGLETDLGMEGFQLNYALTVFYVCYMISDIPSNLLLKRFGSKWLAFLVVGFGVISMGSAFLTSYTGLIISRVFLGLMEGGTLSALVYIISRYYRRHEVVVRVGIFFGLGPSVSGAFGGLLASGLLKVADMGRVKTWRKIFLVEGRSIFLRIITTIFGIILFFIVPEDPSKSKLLTEAERKLAIARIEADQVVKNQGKKEETTWRLVYRSFSFITVACTFGFVIINMSFQGLSLFLPSVIRSLGNYTTVEVQLRTVPPYLVSALWAVGNAWISARIRRRWLPLLWNTLFGVIGYAISVSTQNAHARYAACFLIIIAGAVVGPMWVIWGTDNAAPDTMRAVVSGAIPGVGAIGAVMAVWTYVPTDAPHYRRGNLGNLSTMSFMTVLIVIIALYIRNENQKRERGERDGRLVGKTEKELQDLGYLHPQFRYQI
ncbi:major facilitator superfamily domain-containing protein [Ephemerocybe angulata]|uniref:Major facilitator superfamily domain-containing protein n=1 Tax=Ephemerocybe angulata TaxID=980116 RepID=A0A8H6HCL5_9AGAR|nr:major facilitator superfamily domain-containing protein [Tulosesus angulatus]